MWPPGRGHFWPQGIIWTNLVEATRWCYIPNIKALRFRRRFSSWKSIFSPCDLDMQWTRTIFKECHKIIPTNFGQNPAGSLGDVLWSNRWRHMTHYAQWTSNDHNSSPWANGSGELKRRPQSCCNHCILNLWSENIISSMFAGLKKATSSCRARWSVCSRKV